MRILLLDVINDNDEFVEGLGLASIAAVLRKEKYKVKLFKSRISHIKFNDIIEYFPDIIGISVST